MTRLCAGPTMDAMSIRSISHAPESLRRIREDVGDDREAQWILCRNFRQFPIVDDLALRRLTELGRVRPDDFLVSPSHGCLRAKELPELQAIFRKMAIRRIGSLSPLLARAVAALWPAKAGLTADEPKRS